MDLALGLRDGRFCMHISVTDSNSWTWTSALLWIEPLVFVAYITSLLRHDVFDNAHRTL